MRFSLYCCVAAVLAALACDDPFALGPATRENGVDTLELFAVNGTPLTKPSAYLLATKSRYRLGVEFPPYNVDFLYRIDSTGAPELVPFAAIASTGQGSSGRSGYLPTETPFDSITVAEQTGYVTDKPFALGVGQVLYLRSGLPNGCFLGIPFYAKLEVLSFDPAERSARFKILVNNNCGYRGLEPGLPEK